MNNLWVFPEKESNEPLESKANALNSDKIYTYSQRFAFVKLNLAFSIFLIISSIIQIGILYSGSWSIGFGRIYFLTIIFLSLIYGIFSFLFNLYLFRHEFREMREYFIFLNLKFVGILFIFSSLFTIAKLLKIVIILLGFRYLSTAPNVEIISLILLFFDTLCLIFSIFVYFSIEGSKITCKILLYISGILLIILCFLLIYNSQKVLKVFSLEFELNTLAINYSLKGLMRISMIFILAIEVIFLFSLRKFKILIFVGANATLLLTVLMALLNGFLIKNLHKINDYFEHPENCINALKYLNYQYLQTNECANKYLGLEESPYLNCPLDEQAFIWEDSINWTKNACINTNCCASPLSIIYYSDIMVIYLLSLGIIGLGFIIMACSYYLGSVYEILQGEYSLSLRFNKAMIVLYILIPIIGILALVYVPNVLPEKQQFFSTDFQTTDANIKQYPSNATEYTASCFLLSEYLTKSFNPKHSITHCLNLVQINSTDVCFDDMRVILMIEGGEINIPLDYNSENIRIYDQRSKLLVFSQSSQSTNFNYLAFEGSIAPLKDFMQNFVQVCPSNVFDTIKYSYSVYQLGVSSYLALDSSNILLSHTTQHHNTASTSNDSMTFNATTIDFNLTDNLTFLIIGKLLGEFDQGLVGCSICFTEGNPEIGEYYECLMETYSDENGIFSLIMNQLIHNVPFVGYLQFTMSGYYPLQLELLLSNNAKNLTNLGYLQMKNMNSSSSSSYFSKTSSKSTSSTNNGDSSSEAISLLETQLDDINFGDLNLEIIDMITLEPLDQVFITLYAASIECKTNLQTESLGTFVIKTSENLTFYNLEYNTYTFFVSKTHYKTNCMQITIDSEAKSVIILLSPKLENNQIRIQFQWFNSNLDLGLFLMYKSPDNSSKCVVSYQNKQCEGVQLLTHENLNGTIAQIITIESWQNLTYLVYIKEIINDDIYKNRTKNNESLNMNFLYYSNFIMRYYVNELDLPVEVQNGISFDQSTNLTELLTEENLAYLLFCMKGGVSDIASVPEKVFWTKTNYGHNVDEQYPESDVCSN